MTKPPLTNQVVGRAFRKLADEHFAPDPQRDDATWQKIQDRNVQEPLGLHAIRSAKPKDRRWILAGSAFAAAAVFMGVVTWRNEPEEFTYTVDKVLRAKASSELNNTAGELVASEEQEVRLTFSDESHATLAPHSTIRLTVSDGPRRVEGRLAQGKLSFETGPEPAAELRLYAGTFRLSAVGASFMFSYVPGEGEARLTTKTGEVNIVDGEGVRHRVAANQSLTLSESVPSAVATVSAASKRSVASGTSVASKRSAASKTSAASKIRTLVESGDGERPTLNRHVKVSEGSQENKFENASNQDQQETRVSSKNESVVNVSFAQLAAEGKFSEVVSAAQAQGVSHVLSKAPASEMQELAQAARYTGNLALAAQVWTHMTNRFSGSPIGKNARFFLGRLAEQQGNIALALANYDRYLREAGAGVYTAEALGRKLNLVHKSQGAQKAESVAREYLRLFPTGPYSRAARELLSSSALIEAD